MKKLLSKVEALMLLLKPIHIDWGRFYDGLHAIDLCTAPGPPEWTPEQWENNFVKREGSRDEFIKSKEERNNVRF